jgi:atrophin-1 interacting protein 5 (WW domain-containing E3 ubiquitin protein ligase 1)
MSLYHGKFIDNGFSLPFYKRMLGRSLTMYDLESLDPEFYNSLLWLRENDVNDNDNLELYFNTSYELLGKIENIELKPDGNEIKLTEENKAEYLELMTRWRFTRGVEEQTKAFLHGFNEVDFFLTKKKSRFYIMNFYSVNIYLRLRKEKELIQKIISCIS